MPIRGNLHGFHFGPPSRSAVAPAVAPVPADVAGPAFAPAPAGEIGADALTFATTATQERDFADIFEALRCPARLKLLLTLCATGPLTVTELAEQAGVPQPTLSHRLGVLKTAGLVECRRRGKSVWYEPTALRYTSASRDGTPGQPADEQSLTIHLPGGLSVTLAVAQPTAQSQQLPAAAAA